jgi:hypothetical protein
MPAPSIDAITRNYQPVETYRSYAEAQRAVDHLSDNGFPVGGTLIMGVDLRTIERVLGRQTYLRAAGKGAVAGAWFGLLIGLFYAIFTPRLLYPLISLVLTGLIWGAIAGAIFGLISHALSRGERDFVSTSTIAAERYEVLVETSQVGRAHELLAGLRG